MSDVLGALYLAERDLLDESIEFDFADWRSCACGFIYRGATSVTAPLKMEVMEPVPSSVYDEVIRAVAKALGRGLPLAQRQSAPIFVSGLTSRKGRDRQAALWVVREAIVRLEQECEAAEWLVEQQAADSDEFEKELITA